jgi:hypothetical protein
VDNFSAVFFFNDFNAQIMKCVESILFIDFLWITEQGCG